MPSLLHRIKNRFLLHNKNSKDNEHNCFTSSFEYQLNQLNINYARRLALISVTFWSYDKFSFVNTAWKVSKYGVFSGLYFPVFSPGTGKYKPEKTPHLDTFHILKALLKLFWKELPSAWLLKQSLFIQLNLFTPPPQQSISFYYLWKSHSPRIKGPNSSVARISTKFCMKFKGDISSFRQKYSQK